jgi:hypothetical protein
MKNMLRMLEIRIEEIMGLFYDFCPVFANGSDIGTFTTFSVNAILGVPLYPRNEKSPNSALYLKEAYENGIAWWRGEQAEAICEDGATDRTLLPEVTPKKVRDSSATFRKRLSCKL